MLGVYMNLSGLYVNVKYHDAQIRCPSGISQTSVSWLNKKHMAHHPLNVPWTIDLAVRRDGELRNS